MKASCNTLKAMWREDEGVLTFEWVLLVTLLTIGVVAGLTAVRDAIIDELADVAEAAIHFDQSYSVAAFSECGVTAPGFEYEDELPLFERCERAEAPVGNAPAPVAP